MTILIQDIFCSIVSHPLIVHQRQTFKPRRCGTTALLYTGGKGKICSFERMNDNFLVNERSLSEPRALSWGKPREGKPVS